MEKTRAFTENIWGEMLINTQLTLKYFESRYILNSNVTF